VVETISATNVIYSNYHLEYLSFAYLRNCDCVVELVPSNSTTMRNEPKLHPLLSKGISGIWGIQYITAFAYLIVMWWAARQARWQWGNATSDVVIEVVDNSLTSETSISAHGAEDKILARESNGTSAPPQAFHYQLPVHTVYNWQVALKFHHQLLANTFLKAQGAPKFDL